MKHPALFALVLLVVAGPASAQSAAPASAAPASAAPTKEPTPSASPAEAAEGGATVIYRQVLPDGRIVYSDKAAPGAKVDHTIKVAPPIEGNLWTTEPGTRPAVAPQSIPTPIRKTTAPLPPPAPLALVPKSCSEALLAEAMRAEMLLEDAKKRQAAGRAPRSSELRNGAEPPYTEAYAIRQMRLARDVAYAEQELKKANAAKDCR